MLYSASVGLYLLLYLPLPLRPHCACTLTHVSRLQVLIPVCQLCAGTGTACGPSTSLCECTWYDEKQEPITRCDVRSMALGLAEKVDPNVRTAMEGRRVTSGDSHGVVKALCSDAALQEDKQRHPLTAEEQATRGDWWEVVWEDDDGTREHMQWPQLVSSLSSAETTIGEGCEDAALEVAKKIGQAIKPRWVSALLVAEFEMDGRPKCFHAKVAYNKSGGRTAELWQRCKAIVWGEVHDQTDIFNREVVISDGATGLVHAPNNVCDILSGSSSIPTSPNASAVAQVHDDTSLHGHATNAEEAKIGDILAARRAGDVSMGIAADPYATISMDDFAEIMTAGTSVMNMPNAMKAALKNTGMVPPSIAAILAHEKTVNDLGCDESHALASTLYNRHCDAMIRALAQGLEVRHLRCASAKEPRRQKDASMITAEDMYLALRGKKKSTGTLCAHGLYGRCRSIY